MSDRSCLIAGGGIAGLASALAMAGAGLPVRLFEQAEGFEEVGAGLQMGPNAVRALRALGAWDAIEPHCVVPSEIHVRDGPTGHLLRRIRLGKPFEERFGAPYRVSHRADLLSGLLATVRASRGIDVATRRRALSAESQGETVTLAFDDGSHESGALLIAADGIRSALRNSIAGPYHPVYRNNAIYRALIPFDRVPTAITADAVSLWLCPGGHVVHYAVSKWKKFNVVVSVDSMWRDSGWSLPAPAAEVTAAFTEVADPLFDLLSVPETWLKWAGADLPQLPAWKRGRMTLVGDAAHATLPYLAQGAAMALEDACELGRCIRNTEDLDEALLRFFGLRHARTSRIQAESRKLAEIYHYRGIRRLLRNIALRFSQDADLTERLAWIYSWRDA